MNPADRELDAILFDAIQIEDPAHRKQYLDGACGDNSGLRREIEELLQVHSRAGSFLEQPLVNSPENHSPSPGGGLPEQPSPTDSRFPLNGTLGDFRILREIGRGGMGVVYEADQISLERRVAIKVLPFAAVLDQRQLQRFRTEAKAAGGLHHGNIVPVYQVGCDRAVHFYAMQYIEGQNVSELLGQVRQTTGPRPHTAESVEAAATSPASPQTAESPGRAATARLSDLSTDYSDNRRNYHRSVARLGIQVAEALEFAHEHGILHRDIKPSNLMLDKEGKLWITDFGLARIQGDSGLTMSGDLMGTLRYMSPEQVLGKRVIIDERTDVYSLGVTLYEMLTLKPAYEGADRAEVLRKISFEEPIPLRKNDPSIPADLETIVLTAMAHDPRHRYETAQELADDLKRFLDHKPILAKRPSRAKQLAKLITRNRALSVSLALLLLAVVIAGTSTFLVITERSSLLDSESVANRNQPGRVRDGTAPLQPSGDEVPPAAHQGPYLPGLIPAPTVVPGIGRWQMITQRPRGVLQSAIWSPDGRRVALAEDQNVRIYDGSSFRLQHVLVGHTKLVTSVTWSKDGQRIASASRDGTVRLWTSGGVPTRVLEGHSGIVRVVAWSPDGNQLASAGQDHTVRLWGADGLPGPVLKGPVHPVNCLAWSPDGSRLVAGSGVTLAVEHAGEGENGGVYIWNVDGDAGPMFIEHASPVRCVDWSPDGQWIATGGDNIVRLLAADGKPGATCAGHGQNVNCIAWSSDGQLIASGDLSGELRLWKSDATPESVWNAGASQAVAWSPDGQTLLATNANSVGIWNTDGITSGELAAHRGWIYSAVWSPDGSKLVLSGQGAQVWNADGTPRAVLEGGLGVSSWSPDGQWIAAGSTDGSVRLWNPDGQPVSVLAGPNSTLIYWSPDGNWIASLGKRNEIQLNERDGTAGPALAGHSDYVRSVSWSPDSRRLASASQDGTVRLWEVDGRRGPVLTGHHGSVESVSWSPDGKWIASAGDDNVRLWNADGKPGTVIDGHQGEVRTVRWSPDGRWLASAGTTGVVRLWKADGAAGPVLDAHTGEILLLDWNSDAQHLLSCSLFDGTIRNWDITDGGVEWIIVTLPDGHTVTLSDSGVLRNGDAESVEENFLYLVEQFSGAMKILTSSQFQKRYGKQLAGHYAKRAESYASLKRYDQALAEFNRVIALTPEQPYFSSRGFSYAALGNTERALADYATAAELSPETAVYRYYQALLHLAAGDANAYQDTAVAMVQRFGETEDAETAHWTVWARVLAPESVRDPSAMVSLSKLSLQADPKANFYRQTLGAALYRAGQFDEALAEMSDLAEEWDSNGISDTERTSPAYTDFFLAMIQHRLGQVEAAEQSLAAGIDWMENNEDQPPPWNRRLTLNLLRQEAELLLAGETPYPHDTEATQPAEESQPEEGNGSG